MSDKPNTYVETPSATLRFVERDGNRILQQAWEWEALDKLTHGASWKDVPLEPED